MILPGSATLTVQSLPFVGLNTAVGLVVSSSAAAVVLAGGAFEVADLVGVPLGSAFAPERRFRF